jgi:hypothetical protein
MPQPAQNAHAASKPLAEAIIVLAGTPDDMPGIDTQLQSIVQLAADRVGAADYASSTKLQDNAYSTVAASSAVAEAVDAAQYDEQAGPCLQALDSGVPVTVPDLNRTIRWPKFRETAIKLGLHASVSMPLFVGSGKTVAALNMYGRDAVAMEPLIVGVWALFRPDELLPADRPDLQPLDAGGEELLNGFAEALTTQSTIQLALGVIMGHDHVNSEEAYLSLRLQAAQTDADLLTVASEIVVSKGFSGNENRRG